MAESEVEPDGAVAVSGFLGWIGALSSAVLVGGLVWWAYDLATRDARGVPVVRAMAGPMSVPPEDPGGYRAAHQGYAVNNVASEGEAAPLSERIALAPEPTSVAEEDKPRPQLADPSNPDTIRNSVDRALAEIRSALGGDVPADGASDAEAPTAEPEADDVSGELVAPRPAPRPDPDLVTRASLTMGLPTAPPAQGVDIAPEAVPPGSRLVQLGAYDSLADAQAEWARLSARFADYMASKRRLIEAATIGDQTFYRLRAYGFGDLADARNFCSALIAEQADCIPVLTR